jgi:putative transposase
MTNASGAPGSWSVGSIRTRLLSDNGPCHLSGQLCRFLESRRIEHTRGTPYHPNAPGTSGMTQGKIERYHR